MRWHVPRLPQRRHPASRTAAARFPRTERAQPYSGVNDEGGQPFWFNGQPRLEIGATTLVKQGGSSYDGSALTASGIALGEPQPYTVRFTRRGSYTYFCTIHPGMSGPCASSRRGQRVPTRRAGQRAPRPAARPRARRTARRLARPEIPARTISGGSDRGSVNYLRFFPRRLTIDAGQTVRFTVPSKQEPHTLSVGPKAYLENLGENALRPTGRLAASAACGRRPGLPAERPAADAAPPSTGRTTATGSSAPAPWVAGRGADGSSASASPGRAPTTSSASSTRRRCRARSPSAEDGARRLPTAHDVASGPRPARDGGGALVTAAPAPAAVHELWIAAMPVRRGTSRPTARTPSTARRSSPGAGSSRPSATGLHAQLGPPARPRVSQTTRPRRAASSAAASATASSCTSATATPCFREPHSMHFHGVHYAFGSDGSYIPGFSGRGAKVMPGQSYTYSFTPAPTRAACGPTTTTRRAWRPRSPAGSTARSRSAARSERRADREFTVFFGAVGGFQTINGRAFVGNTPVFRARVGETVAVERPVAGRRVPHVPSPRAPLAHARRHAGGHAHGRPGRELRRALEGGPPGTWLYHCHVETHMTQGMIGIYRVRR